jgi:polyketide cyclase/dehydrase/lipid transport protein
MLRRKWHDACDAKRRVVGMIMAEVRVEVNSFMQASPDVVYRCIADYRQHHPNFLPPAFSNSRVEEGGYGAGTVISFQGKMAGRVRQFRMAVSEPEPGRVLIESDTLSSMVTHFVVTPERDGSRVSFDTRWKGAPGIGGFFERLFAPMVLRRLYRDELGRLDMYARGLSRAS